MLQLMLLIVARLKKRFAGLGIPATADAHDSCKWFWAKLPMLRSSYWQSARPPRYTPKREPLQDAIVRLIFQFFDLM